MKLQIQAFFDSVTSTLTYVVFDPKTFDGVVIDPVLDFDPASGATSENALQPVCDFIRRETIKLHFILETHAHADHLSGSQVMRRHFKNVPVAIGANITRVQQSFKKIFNLPADFPTDGQQFDRLLKDNETFSAGSLSIKVIGTPGHTPACSSYLIGENLFSGDALFMPDSGTGRCDFPDGSAKDLYRSVHDRIYALPEETKVFVGHDYQPNGRALAYTCTVAEAKAKNSQLTAATSEVDFIKFRQTRDRSLSAPRLLFPSVQFNINGGHPPATESNGTAYFKTPLTLGNST